MCYRFRFSGDKRSIVTAIFCVLMLCFFYPAKSQTVYLKINVADKPLFRDPIFDGAADPTVIFNPKTKKWLMFYTNRRASDSTAKGVTWVHGTKIGIAESKDGAHWKYRGTANIDYQKGDDTYWAPEIVADKGMYHMFLTYVPGIFTDWNHPRNILHLTSKNLYDWHYESTLNLNSDKVIDACVIKLPNGSWRLWYNNEKDHKSIYYADSQDLYSWKDQGKAVNERGEGPKVFYWQKRYWMIIDLWRGQAVYQSDDLLTWKKQEDNLLQQPGKGKDDGVIGGHADVIVNQNRAYLFYFTHPGRTPENAGKDGFEQKRSSIQVVELQYEDGKITCNRDLPTYINLKFK